MVNPWKKDKNSDQLPRVAVAISGGVDSAVAAALLKKQGYDVVGVFMHNWTPDPQTCRDPERDRRDALKVALQLKIPFRVWDFEKEYRREVIDYFYREYACGRTPNPDVVCNRQIKFGRFLKRALKELQTDYIATGHYARIFSPRDPLRISRINNGANPTARGGKLLDPFKLLKGVDPQKDQSYFLWTLTQRQLARTLFPLGELAKSKVRSIARRLGLPVAEKPDSTGICFVGEVNLHDFLKRRLPEKEGKIVDLEGNVLGKHPGAWFFTVGQRQGLGIGGGIPYYVVSTDVDRNLVIVAPLNHPVHFAAGMVVSNLNWIAGEPPRLPFECAVKIRYRQPDVPAMLYQNDDRTDTVLVKFAEPQRAVTPGQSAVFYRGDELIGGGVIHHRNQQPITKALD